MADNFQEKTEQPTAKRLEEAREKGNVARSMEVNSALVLLSGISLLYFLGGKIYMGIFTIARGIFSGGYLAPINNDSLRGYILEGLGSIGVITLLFMVGVMVIGLAANIAQVGFLLTLEPITPKPDKINPFKGIKKLFFSKRTIEELAKNLLKLGIVITIAYFAISSIKEELLPLADQEIIEIITFMTSTALSICLKIALALMVIAAADFAFQKYDHTSNLKMTKQEVKDENKQMEGDPKIKARIRSMQLQMSRNRMMQEVPKADVVITNPTHYAVALRYDPEKMNAPLLVAKGQNRIALKIREIAEEHNIPIMEDPPLARALYKSVEINQEVPSSFFQALAEVLAYVFKMKNKSI